jgi:hypoxanthine phosphoribosyltransferase
MNSSVINLSWQDIEDSCINISHKIKKDFFNPDITIPVLWGGAIPSRILMDIMNLDREQCISVVSKSYEACESKKEIDMSFPSFFPIKRVHLSESKFLIIDDIIDSGRTIESILKHLIKQIPSISLNNIKVATICCRKFKVPSEIIYCDNLYYDKIVEDEWVVFPWDKQEYMRSNFA